MAAPRKIDWDRIEPDWRAGIKSVLQIAADYEEATGVKVSHTGINKHFRELGVPRDLSAKVHAKAEAIVSASMVSGMVSTATTETDAKIINDSAMIVAQVHLSQRNDIQRGRKLAMLLLGELEQTTENNELFDNLAELMNAPDEKGYDKLNEIYRKVIAMPQRIDAVKKLAETLKILVAMEREAFGIKDASAEDMAKKFGEGVAMAAADAYARMLNG